MCSHTVTWPDRSGQHPAHVGAGGFSEKWLTPLVKSNPPWIRDRQLRSSLKVAPLRVKAKKSTVRPTNRSVGRLYIGMQKDTFSHVDCSRWIRGKCTDYMMSIMVIKAAQDDLPGIRIIISIGI